MNADPTTPAAGRPDGGPVGVLRRLFGGGRPARAGGDRRGAPRFSLPAGHRVYAIGDIHGHFSLLEELLEAIDADQAAHPIGEATEVFVGDYIDRGPDSNAVVQHLATRRPHNRARVCLRGNHEDYMVRFFDDPGVLFDWSYNGGVTTLASYGVHVNPAGLEPQKTHQEFMAALPAHHRDFVVGLAHRFRLGDVCFVHAGIRPGVPFEEQDPHDLITIRREFLNHPGPLPVRVVHGHTPVAEPVVTPYRIGIDTGAFASGILTCAVLEGADVRFLATG